MYIQLFLLSIFGQREIRNRLWLYLDNHLEKFLEVIFPSKYIFLTIRMNIKSLLELLLEKLLKAIFSSKFIFLTIRINIESLLELLIVYSTLFVPCYYFFSPQCIAITSAVATREASTPRTQSTQIELLPPYLCCCHSIQVHSILHLMDNKPVHSIRILLFFYLFLTTRISIE